MYSSDIGAKGVIYAASHTPNRGADGFSTRKPRETNMYSLPTLEAETWKLLSSG